VNVLRVSLPAVLMLMNVYVPTSAADGTRSNVVFFLVDDLGWADIGAYGSTFYETPHIDALAASGMKFNQAYAACPVCSPTRASLMTGRHPVRVDITDWIKGRRTSTVSNPRFQHVHDRDELALEETTIAEELAEHGYQTCFAGKWHLGGEGFLPTDQGFDVNIGGFHVGSPPGGYYSPWKNPYLKSGCKGEYLTQRLTNDSIRFIRDRDASRPFFLYLSYYNVHTPIQPDIRTVEEYRNKSQRLGPSPEVISERSASTRTRQDNPDYASMVGAVDRSVGEVLLALEELGLSDNTVVCFFSDNGGLSTLPRERLGPTSNLPLRAGKGWLYEGGIREPMLIRAPGVTRQGSVSHEVVCSMDFYPTLLQLVGLPLQHERHCDGISLMSVLDGTGRLPERSLYWHYPHYHGSAWTPGAAMREGRWKMIEFYESDEVELYDMESDIGELSDLSEQHPSRVTAMRQQLRAWQGRMQARMPRPNPDWQPPKD
jgi:arylsulfatase A-like enzyme